MSLPEGLGDALHAACVAVLAEPKGGESGAQEQTGAWPSLPDDWELRKDELGRLLADCDEWLRLTALENSGDRSQALLDTAGALCRVFDDRTVFNIMVAHPTIWAVALDKREGNAKRARTFLWEHSIKSARERCGPPLENTFDDEWETQASGESTGPALGEKPALNPFVRAMHSVAEFGDGEPAPREWVVDEFVQRGKVTILAGNGGDGKTLGAMQLQAAMALGLDWFGLLRTRGGRSLGVYLEDDAAETHRRFYDIARHSLATVSELGDAHFLNRDTVPDNLLMTFGREGVGRPTKFLDDLRALVLVERFDLLVLDPAANLFGGNENDRSQVTQFITALRALAHESGCAVLLLVHPSRAGMTAGTGEGGSTAWTNAVRSRLFLNRVKVNGIEINPNGRTLTKTKANYSSKGDVINLEWRDGAFEGLVSVVAVSQDAADELLFLELLREFDKSHREVTVSPQGKYAPRLFANYAIATKRPEGMSVSRLEGAMNRLLKAGRLEQVIGISGRTLVLKDVGHE